MNASLSGYRRDCEAHYTPDGRYETGADVRSVNGLLKYLEVGGEGEEEGGRGGAISGAGRRLASVLMQMMKDWGGRAAGRQGVKRMGVASCLTGCCALPLPPAPPPPHTHTCALPSCAHSCFTGCCTLPPTPALALPSCVHSCLADCTLPLPPFAHAQHGEREAAPQPVGLTVQLRGYQVSPPWLSHRPGQHVGPELLEGG